MQEEIAEKSIDVAVRVASLTLTELLKALDALKAALDKEKPEKAAGAAAKGAKAPEPKHGRQTLKQLHRHNEGLSTIELKEPHLRTLNREMKRSGVDFSCVRDGRGKYTLFFKGKDADSITHAISRYASKVVARQNRPTIASALAAAKAAAQKLAQNRNKEKNRGRGAKER